MIIEGGTDCGELELNDDSLFFGDKFDNEILLSVEFSLLASFGGSSVTFITDIGESAGSTASAV